MNASRRRWWSAGCLVLAAGTVALSGAFASKDTSDPTDSAAAGPPPVKVAVALAEKGPLAAALPGIGTLEAVRQVTIPAEVDGRITRLLFEPGARVRAGQLLVQLNDAPEQGDVARLTAQLTNARALLERTRRLVPLNAATVEQLDQAQAAHDQTRGELQRLDALIAQKRVTAPFDGVLGIRQVHLGQFVRAGDAIVTLTDSRLLFANFTLPEQVLGRLARGQQVTLTVDAHPGREFIARLTTIEPQVSATARTVRVQAQLRNPDDALTPGMFVNARVALPPRPDVITVPETAVTASAYGDSVFLVQDAGEPPHASPGTRTGAAGGLVARQTYVRTGQRLGHRIVIEEGLEAGARVVTSGQLRLHNGAPVTLVERDTLSPDAGSPERGAPGARGSTRASTGTPAAPSTNPSISGDRRQ